MQRRTKFSAQYVFRSAAVTAESEKSVKGYVGNDSVEKMQAFLGTRICALSDDKRADLTSAEAYQKQRHCTPASKETNVGPIQFPAPPWCLI